MLKFWHIPPRVEMTSTSGIELPNGTENIDKSSINDHFVTERLEYKCIFSTNNRPHSIIQISFQQPGSRIREY